MVSAFYGRHSDYSTKKYPAESSRVLNSRFYQEEHMILDAKINAR